MARPPRVEFPGGVYHVMARGNARQDIYISNRDRISFLHTIEAVSWKQGLVCHAYCMMNNHFHLLVETPKGNLSRCMKYLNGVYTQGYNFRHGRTGHVFEGRYKSNVVDRDAYLLELARYIILNPVRASLVNEPAQWPWSSYNATAGYTNRPSFLTTALIPGLFSDDGGTARRLYREFVLEGMDRVVECPLKKVSRGGLDGVSREPADSSDNSQITFRERTREQEMKRSLLQVFAGASGKEDRNRRICFAYFSCGYKQNEIAEYLGIHYSTVSRVIDKSRGQVVHLHFN